MTYLCLGGPILLLIFIILYRIYLRNKETRIWEEFGPQSVSTMDSIKSETTGAHRGRGFKIKIESLFESLADEELLLGGLMNMLGGGKSARQFNDNLRNPARRYRDYRIIEIQLRYTDPIKLWIRKSRKIIGMRLDYGSEIKTGDSSFDRDFVIYGDPAYHIQNVLSSPTLRQKLQETLSFQVTGQPTIIIDNRLVKYQTTSRLADLPKIKSILDVLCELAEACEKL